MRIVNADMVIKFLADLETSLTNKSGKSEEQLIRNNGRKDIVNVVTEFIELISVTVE